MPIGAIGASLIGTGVSALSSLFGGHSAQRQARKQRQENRYLAEYQYSKDLEQWNRANEYNDPSQQMARLKKAGLNPNMIYGTGSQAATGNTATQTPKYQRPEVPRASMKLELPNMLGMLSQYQDIQNKGLQADIYKTQNELFKKDLILKDTKNFYDKQKTLLSMSQRSDLDNTIGLKIKKLENEVKQGRAQSNITNKDWIRYRDHGLPQNSPWYTKLIEDMFKKYIKQNIGGYKK